MFCITLTFHPVADILYYKVQKEVCEMKKRDILSLAVRIRGRCWLAEGNDHNIIDAL